MGPSALPLSAAVVADVTGVLDQRYQPPLGVTIAIDVPLRGLDRAMTGEQLNIAQRATSFMNKPRGPRNKRSATRMGRATLQIELFECTVKPDNDTKGRHSSTLL